MELLYYPHKINGPVREYLLTLKIERPKAAARLAVDLQVLSTEGLRAPCIVVRPLGHGLWELKRSYEGIQYRLFFTVHRGAAWFLHHIEKKSAKTPRNDLKLALRRLKEVVSQ